MKAQQWFERIDRYHRETQFVAIPLIIGLIGIITLVVDWSGGVKFGYSHAMYAPVLIAGFVFGRRGGVLVGVVCGLALGPFMFNDITIDELQYTQNWLFRTASFVIIGFLAGLASDSTRAYQRQLRWLLQHNVATRLPNRAALLKNLKTFENLPPLNPNVRFLLVVICCDNEIELKSSFGSEMVEKAIIELCERFSTLCPEALAYHTDTAQISVLFRVQVDSVDALVDELLMCAKEPVLYNDVKVHIDTRMGYHCFDQNENPRESLHSAEAALTAAKQTSRDIVAYSPEITLATQQNINLLGELNHAIKNGQLSLHYQPKVEMASGRVYGVEALLRWQHPTQGNIPPGRFIPRAEQSTLIDMITEFVLQQAIKQLAAWQKIGINVCISVNISTRNLLQKGFTDSIASLLTKYDLNGELLELEVTENSLMLDMKRCVTELNNLKALGILISIDDFGTGYSSLQYLHQLPISVLKIDQSFVRRLTEDEGATYILEAAIMLAHKMGITAIAEGVETDEVYTRLHHLGCDKVQGYLISKPISAPDFEKWYQAQNGVYPLATASG